MGSDKSYLAMGEMAYAKILVHMDMGEVCRNSLPSSGGASADFFFLDYEGVPYRS